MPARVAGIFDTFKKMAGTRPAMTKMGEAALLVIVIVVVARMVVVMIVRNRSVRFLVLDHG